MSSRTRPHPAPASAGLFFDRRHLLGLQGLPREDLLSILADAADLRERTRRRQLPCDELRHITVCGAFFEDSTRTRTSFEIAAKRMGAISVTFAAGGSSLSKGESLLDTMRVIQSMRVDILVVRHPEAGALHFLAQHLDAGIVNAGDGAHEHPTQGLLDLLALSDAWQGRFEGRRIAIVGDIAHSRVARSAIFGLRTLGVEILVAGPATLLPAKVESLGVGMAPSVEDAMRGADATMALRIQRERMDSGLIPSTGEYARVWGIDAERVALMKPHGVVLHPGPVNRDVELSSEVMDSQRSVIFDQVENGVAVRCAVLRRCAAALEVTP